MRHTTQRVSFRTDGVRVGTEAGHMSGGVLSGPFALPPDIDATRWSGRLRMARSRCQGDMRFGRDEHADGKPVPGRIGAFPGVSPLTA